MHVSIPMKRLTVCLMLCLACAVPMLAQTWAYNFGRTAHDMGHLAFRTADGGIFLLGGTSSYGAGGGDIWALKLDAGADIVWQKYFGGTSADTAYAAAETSDGGFIIAGSTESYGAGFKDGWLIKLDANGAVQWQKTYGWGGFEVVNAVTPTSDGGFAAVGFTDADAPGYAKVWVLKVNASGDVQWSHLYGGEKWDYGLAVLETGQGNLLVAAVSYTTRLFGDPWLLRLDASGNVLWERYYGGAYTEWFYTYSVTEAHGGGFLLAGLTQYANEGHTDVYVLKVSDLGDVEWQKTYGGADDEEGTCVTRTSDGGYLIGAFAKSYGLGGMDIWLLKIDGAGTILWENTYGGASDDEVWSVEEEAGGGLLVAGTTRSYGSGGADVLLFRLGESGDIDDACVFPDPTSCGGSSPSGGGAATSLDQISMGPAAADSSTPGGNSYDVRPTCEYVSQCIFTVTAQAAPSSGPKPLAVSFSATIDATDCTDTPSYTWEFGDGDISNEESPTHLYENVGNYNWSVTVEMDDLQRTAGGQVQVTQGPTCTHADCDAFPTPGGGQAPLTVDFTATVEAPGCPEPFTYHWDFGDGSTSAEEHAQHVYAEPGTYHWTYLVIADAGLNVTCSDEGDIIVGEPCVVTCSATADPTSGPSPLVVAFDGEGEATNCGPDLTFLWNFGDGFTSLEEDPVHTYNTEGDYDWSLTVESAGVTCTRTGTIHAGPSCVIECTASADSSGGPSPLDVNFTSTVTTDGCIGGPAIAWDFGDGSGSTEADPIHTYDAAGTYGWTFTAEVDGQSCTRTGTVTATEPCILTCGGSADPDGGTVPLAVSFTGTASTQNCPDAPVYAWNFGDGSGSAAQSPTHEYATPGTYTWTLTVTTSGESCADTGTVAAEAGIPGDCDDDGAISIGEVQRAINMFLGSEAPDCHVDADGSGAVSIGEVQKVINGFLGNVTSC